MHASTADRGHSSDPSDEIRGWFLGRLPEEWFAGPIDVTVDRDEILVVGTIAPPSVDDDEPPDAKEAALEARITGFREDTRARRMQIAAHAQRRFGRTVSWGVGCADRRVMFTTLSVPAMTRLRMGERRVLDTLVEAGVARSRSHALAWCVRLVAERQEEWLAELREALERVEHVRAEGPKD